MAEPTYRILVADDDEMIRTLHAEFVRGFGYEVETASDGIEAIAKIGLGVDLVLTDAHMPNMDGFEVARRTRASGNYVTILMLTAKDDGADVVRGLEEGADDVGRSVGLPNATLFEIDEEGGSLGRELRRVLQPLDEFVHALANAHDTIQ